jgi:hypothetical protein
MREDIFNLIKQQGFAFVLMSIMVWFLYNEQLEMKREIKSCNDSIIDLYRNDHIQMRDIIQSNTDLIEHITSKKSKKELKHNPYD